MTQHLTRAGIPLTACRSPLAGENCWEVELLPDAERIAEWRRGEAWTLGMTLEEAVLGSGSMFGSVLVSTDYEIPVNRLLGSGLEECGSPVEVCLQCVERVQIERDGIRRSICSMGKRWRMHNETHEGTA